MRSLIRPIPSSLFLVAGLLALGFTGGVSSLAVQRWQSQKAASGAAHALTGGDADRGKAAFESRGCGACHSIGLSRRADGKVGPPLDGIGVRAFLAGDQPNEPARMIAWIRHPQRVQPGVGMPDMGIGDDEARDLAAYLYTLR